MLTVAKVTQASAAGYAQYLEGKAQPTELGDYYLKDGERVETLGRWAQGGNLFGLGLGEPVSGEKLRTLMDVRRPDTGEPLRRAGGSSEAVAALDATFSVPKSVSAVWAVADVQLRAAIERAHEQAIDRALGYSIKHAAMIRERVDHDTVIHAKPTAVIATSWRHTSARAVADRPPDPQLHSHVLLHGAVRRDGRIVAIDSRSWLVHRREVGAAYRTELAHELNRMGFEIQRGTGRGHRYFELAGVPRMLLDRWSSRHHQVQAAIRERLAAKEIALRGQIAAGGANTKEAAERLALLKRVAQLTPAEERFMCTLTRSPKTLATHRELDQHWHETAHRYRLDRPALNGLRRGRPALTPVDARDLLDGLTEFDATFPARDARAVALERSAGVQITDALEVLSELRTTESILVLADGSGTTREHRSREQATVAIAQRLASATVAPIAPALVARESARLDRELADRGGELSHEQRRAIELACGIRPFVVIEGHAGTGKSTTLTGIARAHQAAGRELIVTSTAAVAAERLVRELSAASVEASAYSTAALHNAVSSENIRLGADTTIIHDEAALASTREQQRLLAAIDDAGAKLIEIGDARQSHPVGAGGLWLHLERAARHASAYVELTRNQRAQDPDDRRDQSLFRDGQQERAIRGYAARGRVHLTNGQPQAEDSALDAAHADRAAGKTTIVIAQTSNEHLDELNARAQAIRHQHGQLGPESVPVPGRPYALHPLDEVQIRRTIRHAQYGQLRNGTTAQVADVDPDAQSVTLRLADRPTLTLDREQAARSDLRLAYIQHPFPAQGQTTDTAHLIVGEHATREGSYVALTRAREQTHIHASPTDDPADSDRLHHLAERMSRTEPDAPSLHTPLANESAVTAELNRVSTDPESAAGIVPPAADRGATATGIDAEPTISVSAADDIGARELVKHGRDPEPAPTQRGRDQEPAKNRRWQLGERQDERLDRAWPRHLNHELTPPGLAEQQAERDQSQCWEP